MSICSRTEVYFIDSGKDENLLCFFTSYKKGIESNIIKKKLSTIENLLKQYLFGERKEED